MGTIGKHIANKDTRAMISSSTDSTRGMLLVLHGRVDPVMQIVMIDLIHKATMLNNDFRNFSDACAAQEKANG